MRVDPDRLRQAAEAQTDVSGFIAGMAAGQSLTAAGDGMAGLVSETACRFAATVLDDASTAVHDALTSHATRLTAAADHYRRMDEQLGSRLRTFSG